MSRLSTHGRTAECEDRASIQETEHYKVGGTCIWLICDIIFESDKYHKNCC